MQATTTADSARRPQLRGAGPSSATRRDFEAEALPHARALLGTALHLCRNRSAAEDLVQETLLRAWRGFARYSLGTHAKAWLYTILYRAHTDNLRRRGRTPVMLELEETAHAMPPPQNRLAGGHEALERALAALPEVFRKAVVMRDVQELSYDEIASVLGVPVGTVMSRLHRGRARLRELLRPLPEFQDRGAARAQARSSLHSAKACGRSTLHSVARSPAARTKPSALAPSAV